MWMVTISICWLVDSVCWCSIEQEKLIIIYDVFIFTFL